MNKCVWKCFDRATAVSFSKQIRMMRGTEVLFYLINAFYNYYLLQDVCLNRLWRRHMHKFDKLHPANSVIDP